MAIRLNPVDVIGLQYVEQVSFAGGDPGSGYASLRAYDIAMTLEQNMLENKPQKSAYSRGPDSSIPAGKGGTLSFKLQMRGSSVGEPQYLAIGKHCGLEVDDNTATSTSVGAGGTTGKVVELNSASGFEVGNAVLFTTSAGYEIRFIEGIATNDITLNCPFNTDPTTGNPVAGIYTLTPPTDRGEPDKYFTFEVYRGSGSGNAMKYTLTGCAGMCKIETSGVSTNPMLSFEFQVDSWTVEASAGLAQADDQEEDAIPMIGAPFYVDDDQYKIQDFAFDTGANLQPYTATEGANGRCGWLFSSFAPTIEITPYADVDWYSRLSAPSLNAEMFVENVNASGEGFAVWAKNVQTISVSEEATENEHQSTKPGLQIVDPGAGLPLFAIGVSA
jgi:hypothetical protein